LEHKFTKELYIDRKKKMGANERNTFEYRAGPRALVEIDKKDILQFIATMYGEDSIDPALLKQLELENQENGADESGESSEEESQPSQSQTQDSQGSQRDYSQRTRK